MIDTGHAYGERELAAASACEQDEQSPIDWAAARSLVGGDRELLLELVEMFPGESTAHLDSIRTAVENDDAELLVRSAHSLKGEASCFGASDLVVCALRVEHCGRDSNVRAAQDLIPRLAFELARLVDALARERVPD